MDVCKPLHIVIWYLAILTICMLNRLDKHLLNIKIISVTLQENYMLFYLKVYNLSVLNTINPLENKGRAAVPILCIDDDGLPYEEILRTHDFNIRVLKDIEDIKATSDYPVVICDIKGVGKKFGSQFEGGHIIEEIKKNYPDKVVIAYSGQQFDARYNKFFSMSDFVLTKDIDSDVWVSILDETISKVASPIEQWKRIRDYLYFHEVSTRKVFELEQEYIKAIINKDKSKFGTTKTLEGLSSDVRSVLNGFVASLIFKLIIG